MKNKNLKRILSAVLAIIFIQALCGCGAKLPPNRVSSVADMPGKTVGVLEDSPAAGYVTPFWEKMTIKYYSNLAGMTEDLLSGALDCIVTDGDTADDMIKAQPHLMTLHSPFIDREYRMAISQDNSVLCDNIDSALLTMIDDGVLPLIIDEWTDGKYEPPEDDYESAETITAAIAPTFEPYCFIDEDGNYAGIEPDILREICRRLNVDIEFVETDEENMTYLVESGKVSLAIGRIVDQDDAAVIYTNPYLKSTQVVVVRDSK